jgi:hypothetical protein
MACLVFVRADATSASSSSQAISILRGWYVKVAVMLLDVALAVSHGKHELRF